MHWERTVQLMQSCHAPRKLIRRWSGRLQCFTMIVSKHQFDFFGLMGAGLATETPICHSPLNPGSQPTPHGCKLLAAQDEPQRCAQIVEALRDTADCKAHRR